MTVTISTRIPDRVEDTMKRRVVDGGFLNVSDYLRQLIRQDLDDWNKRAIEEYAKVMGKSK